MTRVRIDLPYVYVDPDRHGNDRVFVRRFGRKIRIRATPGTEEFARAYTEALDTVAAGGAADGTPRVRSAQVGSIGWLAAAYFGSAEFRALDKVSQRTRRGIIEACLREPLRPGGKLVMRDCPYKRVDATHVSMLRDRRADKPGAANNRLKYLSAMFGWAIDQKRFGLGSNPARDVKSVRYVSDGFHTWTMDEVRGYEDRHPVGTRARLAFALLLYLGSRRGDMIRLGPKNMKDGLMTYVPRKTAYVRVDASVKPILPPLAEIIKATTIGLKTFLLTDRGLPFSDAGVGNKMREWCDEAGLPECTAHGLKKIAAVLCAESGATDREMMALFDWSSEKQANKYTAAARKTLLAAEASRLLGRAMAVPAGPGKAEVG